MDPLIKAKNNTLGYWVSPLMAILIVGMSLFILSAGPVGKDKVVVSIYLSVMLLLLIPQIWITSKSITINTSERTIIIKHFFTGHQVIYHFTDIDGYVDMLQPPRGRSFRVLFLVKDEKFIQKISSLIYSNIEEIEMD